ncbi:MAG: MFS transporter [Bacteroidaceae bacterium]|nr:MFS transporter [Bacteroidaceae bacterium]
MQTKHSFKHWQWRVIICSMMGYAVFYFVRKNFSFAMPMLHEEYGISNTSFGVILSIVGIIYGISKFVNGIIADRTNARWHLVLGLSICALVNYIFGFSDVLSHWITGSNEGPDFVNAMVVVMAVLLIINNIFQGCGFAPCNHLMVNWVPPTELATKMSIWNTSHSIGAFVASIICGYLTDWKLCFWVPATLAVLGVFFIIITLRDTPKSVGLPELPNTKTELDEKDDPKAFKEFLMRKVFKNPIIWILAITDLFVYIVRFAVLDWGPTFLQDKGLSQELSAWTVGIFELAGCAGMLCAGWISDKFFASKSQRVCAIEMGLVAICLFVLYVIRGTASPVLILVILSVAGFFLYGPQALLGVVASNQATKKAASSAVGLIGLMSYVSVIFTGVGLGWYSDHFGWDSLFALMAVVSIIGGVIVAVLWNLKGDGYIHEEETK